jgi:hypothetical protein
LSINDRVTPTSELHDFKTPGLPRTEPEHFCNKILLPFAGVELIRIPLINCNPKCPLVQCLVLGEEMLLCNFLGLVIIKRLMRGGQTRLDSKFNHYKVFTSNLPYWQSVYPASFTSLSLATFQTGRDVPVRFHCRSHASSFDT